MKAALGGQDYQQTRDSQTLGTPILATAVPVSTGGHTVGAVRITQSVSAVTSAVRTAILGLVILGAVVLVLALVAGALIAQQIARPIDDSTTWHAVWPAASSRRRRRWRGAPSNDPSRSPLTR